MRQIVVSLAQGSNLLEVSKCSSRRCLVYCVSFELAKLLRQQSATSVVRWRLNFGRRLTCIARLSVALPKPFVAVNVQGIRTKWRTELIEA